MNQLKSKTPLLNNPSQCLGVNIEIINENPPMAKIENLLSSWECQHIIDKARPNLSSSTMIVNNKEVVDPKGRSSRSAYLTTSGKLPENDIVIHRFLTRLSKLIDIPISHFEGMKVVNYQTNQEYKGHYDYFQNHDNFTKNTGDRMYTFFVYLNTLDAEKNGGSTSFPKLNLKIAPVAGTGIFWVNLLNHPERKYFDQTLHAGEMVTGEVEKWGINVWIREKPYK